MDGMFRAWRGLSSLATALLIGVISSSLLARVAAGTTMIVQASQSELSAARQQADNFRIQGINAYQDNEFEEAVHYWQQALTLYQTLGNIASEAQLLGYLGAAASQLKNYPQSAAYFRQALALARQFGDLQQEEEVLNNLTVVYVALGDRSRQRQDFPQTIFYYQQALRLPQPQSGRLRAELFHRFGLAYAGLNQPSLAIPFYAKGLATFGQISDSRFKADILNDLGRAYRGENRFLEALDYHHQALRIATSQGDLSRQGRVASNLGLIYARLGSYEAALQQFQQSLTLANALGDAPNQVIALGNIGAAYADQGNYDRAIEFYGQSLAVLQGLDDSRAEAHNLLNLAAAHQVWQQDLNQATAYYQQSLVIAQAIGDRAIQAEALASLGFVEEGRGNYALAMNYYDQGLALFQAIGDLQGAAMTLNNRAHTLLAWGNHALAANQSNLAQGKLQEARDNLQDAIALLDNLRSGLNNDAYRISLFDTQVMTYNLLQQVQVALGEEVAALETSEQGRARALTALLDEKGTSSAEDYSLDALTAVAQAQNVTIVEYSLIPEDQFIHQGRLRGAAAELYVWVIEPSGTVHFHRENFSQHDLDLEQLITLTRQGIGVRSRGGFVLDEDLALGGSQYLKDFYALLIAPIADWLPQEPDSPIVFIPQGELFLVPFPALMNEAGVYLIERHTLLTAPSIQVLAKAKDIAIAQAASGQFENPQQGALIVGNPVMPEVWNSEKARPEPLANLPGAQLEAETIATLFNVSPLIGESATEESIKQRMPSSELLHFATHGLLDDFGTGIPGAIALAPDSKNDGLLTAAEISNLNLTARLVVLSACDTGLGDIGGDGVIGLSRSFIAAGVPSIVVSLWSVPDAPTAELMTEFYRQMQQGQDKAQALRQAMLVTMLTNPDPRNWAAFTLIGAAD